MEAQKFLVFRRARTRCFLILWHLQHSSILSVRTRYFAVSINKDSGSCPWHWLPQPSARAFEDTECSSWWWMVMTIDIAGSCFCVRDASHDKCFLQRLQDSVRFFLEAFSLQNWKISGDRCYHFISAQKCAVNFKEVSGTENRGDDQGPGRLTSSV